jgi:acid phosphatase type 7
MIAMSHPSLQRRFAGRQMLSRVLVVTVVVLSSALVGTSPAWAADPVIAAAGDIACPTDAPAYNGGNGTATECAQKRTSDLLVNTGLAAVLPLGDNQYEFGQLFHFIPAYGPTWGRVKSISHPVPGNHEYLLSPHDAKGYYDYFNGAGVQKGPAGDRTKGYYSYNIGKWHLIALNGECAYVPCGSGSAQAQWLAEDLRTHPNTTYRCTLAYWHEPRYSSGGTQGNTLYTTFWQTLSGAKVDVILNGHDHIYERFARMDRSGAANTQGMREFVVGTGGKIFGPIVAVKPNSQVRKGDVFGVLRLTLRGMSYVWQFVSVSGQTFTDSGSSNCY